MGRRPSRAERRRDTRSRLLAAAAQVFARRGLQGASLDEVAEHAGFSKGAVYSNFRSKDDLVLAVLEDCMAAHVQAVAAACGASAEQVPDGGGLAARLSGALAADDELTLVRTELLLHALRNPESRYKLAARQRVLRDTLARALEGATAGSGRAIPAPEVASLVLALADGLALQRMLDPSGVQRRLLDDVVHLLVAGP